MIDRPGDLVAYFAIFAIVVLTFGYGYTELLPTAGSNETTRVFSNVTSYVEGEDYFAGAGSNTAEALKTDASAGSDSDSFIVQMGLSLLKLGKIWESMTGAMGAFWEELHLPPEILLVITTTIVITLALSIYAWWRGNQ